MAGRVPFAAGSATSAPVGLSILDYGPASAAGTALSAALATYDPTSYTLIYFPAGTYTWDSVPALPPNITGRLEIQFDNAEVELTVTGPRLLDFDKHADYDTFRHIEISGSLTINANNLGGKQHVIVGTYVAGVTQRKINFDDIHIHDITVNNVPVDPTGVVRRGHVTIYPQVDPTDTLCTITNVTVERLQLNGGGEGVGIAGYGETTGVPSTAHVYLDRIQVIDVVHDVGALQVQSSTPPAYSVIIGGRGYGGWCLVERCKSRYSMDVGFEIDAMNAAAVVDCEAEDSYNVGFYQTNFQAASEPQSQRVAWVRCKARRLLQTNTAYSGFRNARTNSINPASVLLEACSYYRNSTDMTISGEALVLQGGFLTAEVHKFRCDIEGGSWTGAGTAAPIPVRFLAKTAQTSQLVVRGLYLRYNGARQSGAGNVILDAVQIQADAAGGVFELDIDDVQTDLQITGTALSAGSLRGFDIGQSACTIRGVISRYKPIAFSGDSNPRGFFIRGVATLTLAPSLQVNGCDFTAMSVGTEVAFATGNENKDKVFFANNRWRTFPAPAAAITVGASPFDYQNLDGYQEVAIISGGVVTLIELSLDGTNYFATDLIAGSVFLNNADHVRVTYTGAPTMTKLPIK